MLRVCACVCVGVWVCVSGWRAEDAVLTAASQPVCCMHGHCLPACLPGRLLFNCLLLLFVRLAASPLPSCHCLGASSSSPALPPAPKKRGRKSAAAAGGLSEGDVSDWGGGGAAARQQQQQQGVGASREEMRALKDSLRLMAAEVAVSQASLTVRPVDFST